MNEEIRPTPVDLVSFLPYACNQLEAPFGIRVHTLFKEEYVSQSEKLKKMRKDKSTVFASPTQVSTSRQPAAASVCALRGRDDGLEVRLTAVLDPLARLVELHFRSTPVPLFLLKIIALCINFQQNLIKITLRSCPISEVCVHEISNFLPQSQISELCFDETPGIRCDFASLLRQQSQLRSLSVNRCGIDDEECADIAAQLQHPRPGSRGLALLSLASNLLTDVGALALARALRSNRQLRYLNLTDNRLTDAGARALFATFMMFPLSADEIYLKRLRNQEYLKTYRDVYDKYYKELAAQCNEKVEDRGGRRKTITKRPPLSPATAASAVSAFGDIGAKAAAMTVELIGANDEPFADADTFYRDGTLYSSGNTYISYINISYNHLSVLSVRKLIEVLRYQEQWQEGAAGLVGAALEGNPLPSTLSRELVVLRALLERAAARRLAQPDAPRTDKKALRKR